MPSGSPIHHATTVRLSTQQGLFSPSHSDEGTRHALHTVVRLQDLVNIREEVLNACCDGPKQSGKGSVAGEEQDRLTKAISSDEDNSRNEDPVFNFWRDWRVSARGNAIPMKCSKDGFDFFVSHVWQPASTEDLIDHVCHKTDALREFGKAQAALGEHGKHDGTEPWFLHESDGTHEHQDPKEYWRSWLCWVDKASCKSTSPTEAISSTRHALCCCQKFLAVFCSHFLCRLWCVLEWSTFLVHAAPHYRRVELVIHERDLCLESWTGLVTTACSFTLAGLRAENDCEHQELWRHLERLVLTTVSFERYIQATALAFLARHALLLCSRHCAAFGKTSATMPDPAKRIETVVDACRRLGLNGLAGALRSARPKHWWNNAWRHAREIDHPEEKRRHAVQQTEDALDVVVRLINRKLDKIIERKNPLRDQKDSDSRRAGEMALAHIRKTATDPKQMESVTELMGPMLAKFGVDRHFSALHSDASSTAVAHASSTAQALQPELDGQEVPFGGSPSIASTSVDRPTSILVHQTKSGKDPPSAAFVAATNGLVITPRSSMLHAGSCLAIPQHTDGHLVHHGSWSTAEGHFQWDKDTKAMEDGPDTANPAGSGSFAHVLAGLPDGLDPFLRGVDNHLLSDGERKDASTFRKAWKEYRRYVNKWFDKYVCPHLEVWRLRGIRTPSLLEEVLDDSVRSVGGLLLNALCDSLLPEASRYSCSREPSPQCRPRMAPWRNPTLDRLVLMSQLQHLEATGDGTSAESVRKVDADKPAIFASPLPLEKGAVAKRTLICIRSKDEEDGTMQTVQVPGRLGVDALVNAVVQMLRGCESSSVEMTIMVPRLAFKVRGSSHTCITLGLRVEGTLSPTSPAKLMLAGRSSQGLVGSRTPSVHEESTGKDEDSDIIETVETVDWDRWYVKTVAKQDSSGFDDEVRAIPETPTTSPRSIDIRPRAMAALYVAVDAQDPASVCVSPRNPRVARLAPLSSSTFQKAWREMGLHAAETTSSVEDILRNRRHAGPGGLLPSTAVESPKQTMHRFKLKLGAMSSTSPQWTKQNRIDENKVLVPVHGIRRASGIAAMSVRFANPDSLYEWTVHTVGGPLWRSADASWAGTLHEVLDQFDGWRDEACLNGYFECIPIDAYARECNSKFQEERPDATQTSALVPAVATEFQKQPTIVSRNATLHARAPPPLARSLPCCVCGSTDVALLSLERSMLKAIWQVPECSICLVCGHTVALQAPPDPNARPTALDGDAVLEASTKVLLLPGFAENFQHLVMRVLRVNHGQVLVAAPQRAHGHGPTHARSRVAHVSLCTRSAGIAAAAACAHQANVQGIPQHSAHSFFDQRHGTHSDSHQQFDSTVNAFPFLHDLSWSQAALGDTGLDLVYGAQRRVPVDYAIGDLDDQRTLVRRSDISPLVLWAELQYVLSPGFDPDRWIHACIEVLGRGKFSLPGAILMRNNLEKLRKTVAEAEPPSIGQDKSRDEPLDWPLALHRVLVTRADHVDIILGAALRRSGIKAESPAELLAEGIVAVTKKCEGDLAEKSPASDHQKLDARNVIHQLVHRRQMGNQGTLGTAGFRALMRARRTLRQMQVSQFLAKMQERVLSDTHWASDKKIDHVDDVHYESSADEDDDEDDLVEMDDGSQSSSSGSEHAEHARPESLLVQKVIGHAKEYLDYVDILHKAIQVLCVILQTCSSFAQGIHNKTLLSRNREHMSIVADVERLLLDQGFSRLALRTIYRHSKRPHICKEVYSMLEHLIDFDAGHGFACRARSELSTPPLSFFTIIIATGTFSQNCHVDNLTSSLRVLCALASENAVTEPPPLPQGRESEAADALIPILTAHVNRRVIFSSTLELIFGLARDTAACHAFFNGRLTQVLRAWLLQSSSGGLASKWRESVEVESAAEQLQSPKSRKTMGISGKGARLFREKLALFASLPENIAKCERLAWDLIVRVTNGSEQCDDFLVDSGKTIRNGVDVMKRNPRVEQWNSAVQCMNEFARHNWHAHVGRFVSLGGLQSICSEIPNGEISKILPLLVATLGAAKPLPEAPLQPGDPEHPHHPNQLQQSNVMRARLSRRSKMHLVRVGDNDDVYLSSASSSEDDGTGKATTLELSSSIQKRELTANARASRATTNVHGTQPGLGRSTSARKHGLMRPQNGIDELANAADWDEQELIQRIKEWMVSKKVIDDMLRGLDLLHCDGDGQIHMLRIFGELFRATKKSVATQAVAQFELFGEELAGGPRKIFATLKQNIHSIHVVNVCLYLILGAIDESSKMAAMVADIPGAIKMVLDVLWTHIMDPQARRRALKIVRSMREKVPTLTLEIAEAWGEHRSKFMNAAQAKARESGMRRCNSIGQMNSVSSKEQPPPKWNENGFSRKVLKPSKTVPVAGGDDAQQPALIRHSPSTHMSMADATTALHSEDEAASCTLPEDCELYGSVLRVHRYFLSQNGSLGQLPLKEATEPVQLHHWDREVVIVGLAGLHSGTKVEIESRTNELAEIPGFSYACTKAVLNFPEPDVFMPVLRLSHGIMHSKVDVDKDNALETIAVAAGAALDVLKRSLVTCCECWANEETWGMLLEAMDYAIRQKSGLDVFEEHQVFLKLSGVWRTLLDSDEDQHRILVKSHKGMTDCVLEMLGHEIDDVADEEEEFEEEEDEEEYQEEDEEVSD